MAVKFNPFSGQLQIDEKGASASYIDGEVATYNDLPLSSTTAPLDSAWLVRSSSGVWPFTKPGGVYVRTATGGSSRDADYTYAGVFPDVFSDANFTLYDDSDTSKNLKFQLSGIPTATTRTVDAPAGSGRMLVEGQSIGSTTAAAGTFTSLKADSLVLPSTGAPLIYLNTSSGQVSASSFSAGSYTTSSGGNYTIASGGSLIFNSGSSVSGQIVATNGTLTASAPVLDLSQNWNNAAVTFTAIKANITNTASSTSSKAVDIQIGGTSVFETNYRGQTIVRRLGSSDSSNAFEIRRTGLLFSVRDDGATDAASFSCGSGSFSASIHNSNGVLLGGDARIRWAPSSQGPYGGEDLTLFRDAADTLAQRRTTNAQTFRLYNTYTDASNYERAKIAWSSNVLQIGTEKAGTGTARNMVLQTDGVTRMTIPQSGYISTSGIGFATAGGWDIQSGNNLEMANASGAIFWTSGPVIVRDAAYILGLRSGTNAHTLRIYNTSNSSNANFERINFRWASNEFIIDAEAGGTGTSLRGIKIGSATSSLLGFYGATPAAQPAAVADATNATDVITQLNALLSRLRTIGVIAT